MGANALKKAEELAPPLRAANDGKAQEPETAQTALTDADVTLARSLAPITGGVDRARFTVAEVLLDDETLAALETYAPVFEGMSVNVGPAVKAIPMALRLEALERHLIAAQALVHRHLAKTVEPIASISSDVHRIVAASPEGSAIRDAFSMLEKRWTQVYGKGGRPAASKADAPAEPKTPR